MAGIGSMIADDRPKATFSRAEPQRGEPAADDATPNVSPEEQAEYERFLNNAMAVLYPQGGDGVAPAVLDALRGGDDRLMALATTAVSLVAALRDSAKQAGHTVPDEVLYHAGMEIVEELGEIAEAAGIHDYSEDDLEQAWYAALDMYRGAGEQSGDVDPEQLKQQFDVIRQADAQGRLGEVLPGIESRMGKEQR